MSHNETIQEANELLRKWVQLCPVGHLCQLSYVSAQQKVVHSVQVTKKLLQTLGKWNGFISSPQVNEMDSSFLFLCFIIIFIIQIEEIKEKKLQQKSCLFIIIKLCVHILTREINPLVFHILLLFSFFFCSFSLFFLLVFLLSFFFTLYLCIQQS